MPSPPIPVSALNARAWIAALIEKRGAIQRATYRLALENDTLSWIDALWMPANSAVEVEGYA